MLTFSESLTLLKSGDDMRCKSWPAGHFVRLATDQTTLQGYAVQEYRPTQTEMLGHEWERA